ncbi:MAG: hypothetical protein KKB50_11780 [Planctomycetes bacterium]|nr:hypothetical protein [Planctomycetota bacterium]
MNGLSRARMLIALGALLAVAAGATAISVIPRTLYVSAEDLARWRALPERERLDCVRRYESVVSRPDGEELLRHASEFAALPPTRQQQYRALQRLAEDVIRAEPGARRRWLLSLPPRARALQVYQLLEAKAPGELADVTRVLRAQIGARERR